MSNGKTPESRSVALIAGPTASGKSDLAVRLALALGEAGKCAVVINADSAQVYSDLAIVSARPTEAEMRGVPHRLFGMWDGAQSCSAADWAAAAKEQITLAHASDAVPILVGGTGLYLRTLLDGIAPIPEIDAVVREAVRTLPLPDAYAALQAEDPQRAAKLAPADSQRIARALEVVRATGRTLAQWQESKAGGIADQITLAPLILLPERQALYARCDRRFAQMIEHGAVEEVEALLARNLNSDLPVMRAIGVPEICEYLSGSLTMADTIARGQQATRNYAKRQFTWLKHQPPQEWLRAAPDNVEIQSHFEILFR